MSEVVVPDKLNRLFVSYSDSFSKAEATEIIADLRTKQLHPKSDSLESDDLYGTLKELYKTGKIDIDDFAMLELMAGKDRVTKVTSLINDYKRSHVTSKDDGLIGRNQDRKRLLEYLTDKENHAIGLYGPSGVGKTKLARSVGSELERDSWVVLTFDARDLKDVSSLYMCILYELGLTTLARNVQEMQKEQSLADMEKMRILCDLSDKSSHSKTLLIFDNIEEKLVINDKQFSTFINDITNLPVCDKGSLKSIITSTEDLHSYFDLVKPQLLKPLPDRESSQFICRSSKLGQKPDLNDEDVQALSKISEYCRRLPYLLEGAEQIMRNGFISPLQLLQQIEAQIEKGVPENFALTATQFDSISNERLKELAVKICVFQRPFSASAVTKVAEISPDFAAIDLEYLVKHRVVTKTTSDKKARYDVHSLFKDFVASYLRKNISIYDEVYQRAEKMFGMHFVDKLVELANHLEKDFTKVYKKMDKNRLNFEMALQLSTKNKEILEQLLHIKYHENICRVAMLLESLKSISERRRLFKTWADILENEGNLMNSANMRCWESIQLADIEGTASSERILKQAEACLKQASDHPSLDVEQFSAIKGLFLYCEGNLYYRKHVNLSKQEKNKHGLIENALRKLEGSLEFHKQIYGEDHTMIVRIRNMIGNCYMEKEEPDTAEKYYSEALEMMKRLTNGTENHSEIPTFYNQLSQVYKKLGDLERKEEKKKFHHKSNAIYEKAVESLNCALQLNEQLNLSDTLSTATFNRNLANVSMALKRYDGALKYAEKAHKLRNRLLGKHPETVRILYLMGVINEWRKDIRAALQCYEEAFNMEELLPLENHTSPDIVTKLVNGLKKMCGKCNEKRKLQEYSTRIYQLQETIKKQPAKEQPREVDEKELLVDKRGGLYKVPSHGFILHIPQDAFKDKTQITYNHPPVDSLPSPAKDMEVVVSFIVKLGPSNAVPLKPITITLMHSGIVGVPEYENIVMAFDANTQTWEELQEIKDKSLLPTPMEDSPASFIQARLTKLTAVTVVSRLVTDSFDFIVDKQGGLYSVPSHGFILHIPQDAFKDKTQITYNHLPDHFFPSPAKDMEAVVSFIVKLGPSNAVPLKPITITLMHSGIVGIPAYENIVMAFDANTLKWKELQEIKDKSLFPAEDSPASFIQAQLTKLTAVTVVSRLVTDLFEVPVSGQLVRSSVCQDVTVEFLEGAVHKPMKGSLKVLPPPNVLPKHMANVYLSPMVIVDGFDDVTLSKSAFLTLPHHCPSQRPASQIHVMCFKENQWMEITKGVECSEISETRMGIRMNHFSGLVLWIGQMIPIPNFHGLYEWWSAHPENARLGVYISKNVHIDPNDFNLTLFCRPSHIEISSEMRELYVKLGGKTCTMKINEEASIGVEGDYILQEDVILKFVKANDCERQLNLIRNTDAEGSKIKIKIKLFSITYDRPLEELTVNVPVDQFTNRDNADSQASNRENKVIQDPTSDVYRMKSDPRGLMVIINMQKFAVDRTLENREELMKELTDRKGSERDVDKLTDLFSGKLKFKVCTIIDKPRKELLGDLRKTVENPDYKDYDCLAVCIMSHGKDDKFYAHDGNTIKVSAIYNMFSNSKFEVFRNKPKLFFIQACRGRRGSGFVAADGPSEESSAQHPPTESKDLDMADMLIAYSSFEDYISYRHTEEGSYFIQSLVSILRQYADSEHVEEILTRVKNEVHRLIQETSQGQTQVPAPVSTLRKKLYFRNT